MAVHIVDPIECELPESRYLQDQTNHQQSVSMFFSSHGHLYVKAQTNQSLLDVASRIMARIPDKVTDSAERFTKP